MKKLKFILVMLIVTNFTFDSKAQDPGVIKPPTYPDGIYTKENSNSRRAIPYPYLREADVMWSKRVWRVIDLKEKINHPLYYPTAPLADRKSLFDVLKDGAIKEGRVKCFSPVDDEFRMELTKSEVEGLLVNWDSTNQTEDPNNPGTMMTSPLKKETTSEEITKYWIKEDWFFDKQRSVLDVRIIGLQVVIAKKTESGEDAGGDKPLFWVYFPEIRSLLANQEVYMRHNDSERRTLEDIFWKRMFSSYVIKETNVYDRYISEYTSGINALFEAERVKEDIFKFEHDLWHF
ncbi:MAG: gliding motility protein GldN [Bacteroidia bacterium]|nr:gliding motility protein GldN [Bacteroidia bacterium]